MNPAALPPNGVPTNDVPAAGLTPAAIDAVLAEFRGWLEQLPADDAHLGGDEPLGESLDLQRVLEHFVALRHDVNLQTKATRAQQEQNAETLRQLGQALESVRQAPKVDVGSAVDEARRPLFKTMIDLADALALAQREYLRNRDALWDTLAQLVAAPPLPPPTPPEEPSPWPRWFGTPRPSLPSAPPVDSGYQARLEQTAARLKQQFEALLVGYTMSVQRLERALQKHGLELIPCVGELFDPELMEVVDATENSGQPAGAVLEEIRRGYRLGDRVIRYAQVRVAR